MEILHIYEENNFEIMEKDFRCKIIPNLINESQTRSQIEDLINNSRLPSITEEFVERKNELKECEKLLQEHPHTFYQRCGRNREKRICKILCGQEP